MEPNKNKKQISSIGMTQLRREIVMNYVIGNPNYSYPFDYEDSAKRKRILERLSHITTYSIFNAFFFKWLAKKHKTPSAAYIPMALGFYLAALECNKAYNELDTYLHSKYLIPDYEIKTIAYE